MQAVPRKVLTDEELDRLTSEQAPSDASVATNVGVRESEPAASASSALAAASSSSAPPARAHAQPDRAKPADQKETVTKGQRSVPQSCSREYFDSAIVSPETSTLVKLIVASYNLR